MSISALPDMMYHSQNIAELVAFVPTHRILECNMYDAFDMDVEDEKEMALCMSTPPSLRAEEKEEIDKPNSYNEDRFVRLFHRRRLYKKKIQQVGSDTPPGQ